MKCYQIDNLLRYVQSYYYDRTVAGFEIDIIIIFARNYSLVFEVFVFIRHFEILCIRTGTGTFI